MLARVKQDYLAGAVTAFSGREYIRSEWREVPAGFEEQAKNHPLLETQLSLEDIRAESPRMPGLGKPEPVTPTEPAVTPVTAVTAESLVEPPAEEPPAEESEPKTSRRRKRPAEE
jgi:hypothetical protein